MDSIVEKIASLYDQGLTMKAIASKTDYSEYKVRKILISTGRYSSQRTAEINALLNTGLSAPQIADKLGVSEKAISAFLPYTKGMYSAEAPTQNALRIRKHRGRNDAEKL